MKVDGALKAGLLQWGWGGGGGVLIWAPARGETGGRGAWWQGPGLGGAALTGPRGRGAAGPYGEQSLRAAAGATAAPRPPPRPPQPRGITASQHKDNTCMKTPAGGGGAQAGTGGCFSNTSPRIKQVCSHAPR